MKLVLTIIILILTAGGISAQESLTLNQAIEAALEYNHRVRISQIEMEKADNSVTRGNAGQLPSLSVTGGLTGSYTDMELTPGSFFQNLIHPGDGNQPQTPPALEFDRVLTTQIHAAAGTQLVIYDGMKGRLRYNILEKGSELAGLQHRSGMENTVLSVTGNYIRAATLQKMIVLKELALEQSLVRYRTAEARREYGQASEQQRLQALADLNSDSTEFRNLRLEYENAYRELHTAIGWERRDTVPLDEDPGLPAIPHYDELLVSLLENNTALNVRRLRIEHAEIEQKISKANFLPTLTASAQYGYNYLHASDGQFEMQRQIGVTGGVTLKIPVFTGGQARTASQHAQANLRQEHLLYDESEQQLRARFDNYWQQFLHLEAQLASERQNLDVYERNYERAQESFSQGLISGLELRSAQLSLHNARLRISETEFQLNLAGTQILYLSGELLQVI